MSASRHLLILGGGRARTVPLPATGELLLGRAASCQVVLDEPGVADVHAVLQLGAELRLRDCASGAATLIGNQPLELGGECLLTPGVVIQLGEAALVVQTSSGSTRLRHVRSHDYFEGRLEDECARAEAQGGSFAVVRLRFARGQARAVEDAFTRFLHGTDLVAMYAADEYELLLSDASAELASATLAKLREHVRAAGCGELRTGFACWARDGRSPEALLAAAGVPIHGSPEQAAALPALGAIERLTPLLERIAPTAINVLILGETGVGKELLARRIHQLSPRANAPLVCLNCAALSETLLESELFGHERGAFTGATQAKPGLLEAAEGGTVLLDEIGEMPLSLQSKLLRVVENRQVTRLGAVTARRIDVRFLAATNRDLEAEIARGAFRSDLYFRLHGVALVLPPLRDRVSEIAPLATTFAEHFARQAGRERAPMLSRAALGVLERYAWPGNVRELRNVIERAVMLCLDEVIDLAHLPLEKLGRTLPLGAHVDAPPVVIRAAFETSPTLRPTAAEQPRESIAPISPGAYALIEPEERQSQHPDPRHSFGPEEIEERDRIAAALERSDGNQTQAARLLGLTRRALITRLERYAIPRPRKGRDDDA